MVSALLKAGASCSGGWAKDGVTPLHAAARGGRYVEEYAGQSYFALLATTARKKNRHRAFGLLCIVHPSSIMTACNRLIDLLIGALSSIASIACWCRQDKALVQTGLSFLYFRP